MKYRTKDGDVVDALCYRLYGRSDVTFEVYSLNPGLAEYGPKLRAGLLLQLPDIAEPSTHTVPKVSLFD